MYWKENDRQTIYNLKNNDLDICIHKIFGLNNLYLSCHKLNITDIDLQTENFDKAVEKAQIIIMEKATKVYELACDFAKNAHDNNEFSRY